MENTLYERAVTDISIDPNRPVLPVQPPPIRHVLADPDARETLCGHTVSPGDVFGEHYADFSSVECPECAKAG